MRKRKSGKREQMFNEGERQKREEIREREKEKDRGRES